VQATPGNQVDAVGSFGLPGEFFDELIKDDGAPVDSIFLTNLFIIVTIGLITFYMTDG